MAPPLRTQTSLNEGRILLALSAFQEGQFRSVRAAATAYKVSEATLRRRVKGGTSREEYTQPGMKLNMIEEEGLVNNILRLDSQGLAPSVGMVRDMASTICKARGGTGVGVNWATNFIRRTPALNTRLGRSYECQRRECEDPGIIRDWFRLVYNTVAKYGILPEDTYNFDETGFQMGMITNSMVVTASDRVGRPKQIKPTNTQWVTLIQGTCADGSTIPPFIIFQGKTLSHTWFTSGLPSTWTFSVSENGWTTDNLGMQWIVHFDRYTSLKTVGHKRLLILDNHGSHTTPQFRAFCEDHNIILLWMPPHSSHLLQPLDVGCFGPLKTAYSAQNEALIRSHIFHVTKEDFLASFQTAWYTAFTPNNILAGFRGAGIHPFNPEAVLSLLEPVIPSSPPAPDDLPSSQDWQPRTPSNTKEVYRQATLIKNRLKRHRSSSPAYIELAIEQLSKGAQLLATSSALMAAQVSVLQKTNAEVTQRKKRSMKAFYTPQPMSVAQGQAAIALGVIDGLEACASNPRRQVTCGRCHQTGHDRRTCPSVDSINR